VPPAVSCTEPAAPAATARRPMRSSASPPYRQGSSVKRRAGPSTVRPVRSPAASASRAVAAAARPPSSIPIRSAPARSISTVARADSTVSGSPSRSRVIPSSKPRDSLVDGATIPSSAHAAKAMIPARESAPRLDSVFVFRLRVLRVSEWLVEARRRQDAVSGRKVPGGSGSSRQTGGRRRTTFRSG